MARGEWRLRDVRDEGEIDSLLTELGVARPVAARMLIQSQYAIGVPRVLEIDLGGYVGHQLCIQHKTAVGEYAMVALHTTRNHTAITIDDPTTNEPAFKLVPFRDAQKVVDKALSLQSDLQELDTVGRGVECVFCREDLVNGNFVAPLIRKFDEQPVFAHLECVLDSDRRVVGRSFELPKGVRVEIFVLDDRHNQSKIGRSIGRSICIEALNKDDVKHQGGYELTHLLVTEATKTIRLHLDGDRRAKKRAVTLRQIMEQVRHHTHKLEQERRNQDNQDNQVTVTERGTS